MLKLIQFLSICNQKINFILFTQNVVQLSTLTGIRHPFLLDYLHETRCYNLYKNVYIFWWNELNLNRIFMVLFNIYSGTFCGIWNLFYGDFGNSVNFNHLKNLLWKHLAKLIKLWIESFLLTNPIYRYILATIY